MQHSYREINSVTEALAKEEARTRNFNIFVKWEVPPLLCKNEWKYTRRELLLLDQRDQPLMLMMLLVFIIVFIFAPIIYSNNADSTVLMPCADAYYLLVIYKFLFYPK